MEAAAIPHEKFLCGHRGGKTHNLSHTPDTVVYQFYNQDTQRVSPHSHPVFVAVSDDDESVGGRLRSHADPRKIPLQQMTNKSRFPRRILTHQQNHRQRLKVRVLHQRRVKFVEEVALFQRQQFLAVDALQALRDAD